MSIKPTQGLLLPINLPGILPNPNRLGGRYIPARPFLALDVDDERQIQESVLRFLTGRLG
jgi:phage gpG-like protein